MSPEAKDLLRPKWKHQLAAYWNNVDVRVAVILAALLGLYVIAGTNP